MIWKVRHGTEVGGTARMACLNGLGVAVHGLMRALHDRRLAPVVLTADPWMLWHSKDCWDRAMLLCFVVVLRWLVAGCWAGVGPLAVGSSAWCGVLWWFCFWLRSSLAGVCPRSQALRFWRLAVVAAVGLWCAALRVVPAALLCWPGLCLLSCARAACRLGGRDSVPSRWADLPLASWLSLRACALARLLAAGWLVVCAPDAGLYSDLLGWSCMHGMRVGEPSALGEVNRVRVGRSP